MAGGIYYHGLIAVNFAGELYNALKGKPCGPWTAPSACEFPAPLCSPTPTSVWSAARRCSIRKTPPARPSSTPGLSSRFSPPPPKDTTAARIHRLSPARVSRRMGLDQSTRTPRRDLLPSSRRRLGAARFSGLDAKARIRCLDIELPLADIYAHVVFPPRLRAAAVREPNSLRVFVFKVP